MGIQAALTRENVATHRTRKAARIIMHFPVPRPVFLLLEGQRTQFAMELVTLALLVLLQVFIERKVCHKLLLASGLSARENLKERSRRRQRLSHLPSLMVFFSFLFEGRGLAAFHTFFFFLFEGRGLVAVHMFTATCMRLRFVFNRVIMGRIDVFVRLCPKVPDWVSFSRNIESPRVRRVRRRLCGDIHWHRIAIELGARRGGIAFEAMRSRWWNSATDKLIRVRRWERSLKGNNAKTMIDKKSTTFHPWLFRGVVIFPNHVQQYALYLEWVGRAYCIGEKWILCMHKVNVGTVCSFKLEFIIQNVYSNDEVRFSAQNWVFFGQFLTKHA